MVRGLDREAARVLADEAGVTNMRFAKGCNWGDVNGDRWPDLIVSNLSGDNDEPVKVTVLDPF